MEQELIVAMAVACIAEENGVDTKHVVVRSFKEVNKSSLEKYIEEYVEDNKIAYHKYQLGE